MRILVLSPSLLGAGICRILEEHESSWAIKPAPSAHPEAILELCRLYSPQISILDATCFDMVALFEQLTLSGMKYLGKTIVATMEGIDEEYLLFLLKWGVAACLFEATTAEDLVTIVLRVAAGEYLTSGDSLAHPRKIRPRLRPVSQVQPAASHVATQRLPSPLSEREAEVLSAIAQGKSKRELSRILGNISEETIKNHLNRIYRKLGVQNRTSAVVCALSKHWINMPEPEEPKQHLA